jgi:metallo-beta-lactamase class B
MMIYVIPFLILILTASLFGQTPGQSEPADTWRTPFAAHRVAGNIYYVGTYDLACFLITTPQGHILINSGTKESTPLIKASVEKLGFRFSDIRVLLTMQAHFDHVAALAEIQKLTGAKMWATEADAKLLRDGGKSDFHLGAQYNFAPVSVSRVLKDKETIRFGNVEMVVHLTPGHTQGSATYSMVIEEEGKKWPVLFANMGSINEGVKLINNAKYPQIAEDYKRTFERQKSLECQIFLSAHASQYRLHEKFKPGDPYSVKTFVDPEGYKAAVQRYEDLFKKQLESERQAGQKDVRN